MNHPLLRWLLDLHTIPPGAEGVRLAWERAFPAWMWALALLAAGALAAWAYARLQGATRGRVILAAVRFLLVVAVLVIVSGPALELPRVSIEQDWVVMLVDRSASLTIPDGAAASARERRLTRDEQLQEILSAHAGLWKRLSEKRHILWMGFHDGAFTLPATPDAAAGAEAPLPVPTTPMAK